MEAKLAETAPKRPLAVTVGAAAATLVVVAGVLTAPTLINCSSSDEGLQACLNGRLADLGLGTRPVAIANTDPAGQAADSGKTPARTAVAVVEEPAAVKPSAAAPPTTAEPAPANPAPAVVETPKPAAPLKAEPQEQAVAPAAQPAEEEVASPSQPQVATAPAELPKLSEQAIAAPTPPQPEVVQPRAMEPAVTAETQKTAPAAAPLQSEAAKVAEIPAPEATATPATDEPGFDLLRAEPDGSLVVAGTGKPGSEIELFSNGAPIGKAEVEPSGDWVLVPEQPLPPGGAELTLGEAGSDERSAQSFVVVIDPEKEEEPLVVASTPGEASEILQGLDREISPSAETGIAAVPPSNAAHDADAKAVATDQAAVPPMQPAQPIAEPDRQAVALAAKPVAPPKTPAGANEMPAAAANTEAPTESDPAVKAGSASREQTVIANVEPAPQVVAPADKAVPSVPVSIDAVEIDGDRNFFAGAGPEGATVRLYVDDRHVGDAVVEDGRWLIETPGILTKPSQRVRVDVLAPGSADVQSRAEVNFVIETPAEMEVPTAVGEAAQPQSAPAATSAPAAPAAEAVAAAPEAAPSVSTPAAQEQVVASQPPATPEPPEQAPAAAEPEIAEAAPVAPAESEKPAELAAAPQSVPEAATPPVVSTEAAAPRPSPAGAAVQPPAPPVETAAAAVGPEATPEVPAAEGVPTMVAVQVGDPEAARFASGKAIIRRGDNLWTIAKRVYGRGMRYTTIWEANTAQIRDPDWIYPGQVFDLPEGEE